MQRHGAADFSTNQRPVVTLVLTRSGVPRMGSRLGAACQGT